MVFLFTVGICITLTNVCSAMSSAQTIKQFLQQSPEKIINSLSLEEKIAQLCVIAAVSDEARNAEFILTQPYKMDKKIITEWIVNHKVGGIIFLGMGDPGNQIHRMEEYQKMSEIPLLWMQDFEWGLAMRMTCVDRYPRAMTLGALPDDDLHLIEEMGFEIGWQIRNTGVHMNLAPVVDINNNPQNPVIYTRAFGDNPEIVSDKAIAYMRGMQRAGILTCAKHFPGHGNVTSDSHYTLPILKANKMDLENTELIPFKKIMAAGVDAIMTAHLAVPSIEPEQNLPASLSHKITTQLLKETLGFNGLVITDGLGMQGVTDHYKQGDLELRALLAGNDILLCPVDLPTAISAIRNAVNQNMLPIEELNKKVLKVLTTKQNILKRWNEKCSPYFKNFEIKEKVFSHAITVVHNKSAIPLKAENNEIISLVSIGGTGEPMVHELKKQYPHAQINIVQYNDSLTETVFLCQGSNAVIVNVLGSNTGRVASTLLEKAQTLITALNNNKLITIGILCACPYLLTPYLKECSCLIAAYENDPICQESAIKVVSGNRKARGHLPIAIPGTNG